MVPVQESPRVGQGSLGFKVCQSLHQVQESPGVEKQTSPRLLPVHYHLDVSLPGHGEYFLGIKSILIHGAIAMRTLRSLKIIHC